MAIRTIRSDGRGVYIETNGTRFRPSSPGRYAAGQRVPVADGAALLEMGTVRVGHRTAAETWRAESR